MPANRDAVARDDKGVTALECTHDRGIVVAQLALRYRALHTTSVQHKVYESATTHTFAQSLLTAIWR